MRIKDVSERIASELPKRTNLFGDNSTVTNIVASSGIATVTTSTAHNLINGASVTISNVETRTPISSFTQNGFNYVFTTSSEHDLTFGWPEHGKITLGGFTDNDWNAEFDLISSENRFDFQVKSADTTPVLNGGEYLLENNRIDGVNGFYPVTVTGTNTFTVEGDFLDGSYIPIAGQVALNPRIAPAVDIGRALDLYTKQLENDFYLFVSPVDAVVSKDRSTYSDATQTVSNGNDIRSRIVDGFNLYITVPTTKDISASEGVDICRHDLLLPLMKTLYGYQLPTGTSNDMDFKTMLKSHGVADYNRAYLVYVYEFEVVIDLTNDDAVDNQNTRAFRNIDYTNRIGGDDTDDMNVSDINLDIDPVV